MSAMQHELAALTNSRVEAQQVRGCVRGNVSVMGRGKISVMGRGNASG